MAMSETDMNQASEPMTATIASKSAPAAVREAIVSDKVVNAAHNSEDNSNDVPVSTVVPSDVDKNDRPISQVVKNQDEKQSASNTGDASSEEESPKLVANLKQPQEVAIPSHASNPVSPSSVEDDASKSTIGGPDTATCNIPLDSVAVTKKPESAVAGEECGAIRACMPPIDTKTKKGKLSSTPSDSLRRGKWTPEEEAYVTRVITDFNAGVLRAPPGTTLRTYLSEKLNCDPMRITKKFTGELAIGKRVFHALPRTVLNAANIDKAQSELDELERKWRKRLEIQEQESARKAAASAAAAASGHLGDPINRLADAQIKRNLIAKTAAWLDRADAILSVGGKAASSSTEDTSESLSKPLKDESADQLPKTILESQIKEVEKLLNEGTLIQKTSKGLPELLQGAAGSNLASSSSPNANKKKRSGSFSGATTTDDEQGTKRPKRSFSTNHLPNLPTSASSAADTADTEGAQALVGLLNVSNTQLQARPSTSSTGSTTAGTGTTNNQSRRHSE